MTAGTRHEEVMPHRRQGSLEERGRFLLLEGYMDEKQGYRGGDTCPFQVKVQNVIVPSGNDRGRT